MFRKSKTTDVAALAAVLSDKPAQSPKEVFKRCQAADDLAAIGPEAICALPALLDSLNVPVQVDCGLALRVAAAAAIWKVSGRIDVVLPHLAWALKDEYWGVAPRAVEILEEIGDARLVPDLVRLAERRLNQGPFHFEECAGFNQNDQSKPLLAAIAEALGACGRTRFNGESFAFEAQGMLRQLVDSDDLRVREAALKSLSDVVEEDG